MSKCTPLSCALGALLFPGLAAAQVRPEIQLGAIGVTSVDGAISSDGTASSIVDFSDSALLLGFQEKLYSDARGGLSIGLQFPDADSDLGQVYFHRVSLNLENRRNILLAGRSRAATSLIEFPTLRDDDALAFTDLRSPISDGENSEDSQYGNVIELSHRFGKRTWLQVHGEHFRRPPAGGGPETSFELNSLGGNLQYRVAESQRWDRDALQQIGAAFNLWALDPGGFGVTEALLPVASASVALNVLPDPVHLVELRYQAHYTPGIGGLTGITGYVDETRAASVSSFTTLGYTYRPLERPALRTAAGLGYRIFPELAEPTSELKLLANSFWRLGEQFDVGVQYQYTRPTGDLAALRGQEHRLQLAMVFSVDEVFNDQFDDRDSILNLEHGYIP